jgi:hypothetical protein
LGRSQRHSPAYDCVANSATPASDAIREQPSERVDRHQAVRASEGGFAFQEAFEVFNELEMVKAVCGNHLPAIS